jgi:hypothetical protein
VFTVDTKLLLKYACFAVCFLSTGAIALIWRRRLVREYAALVALLAVWGLEYGIVVLTLFYRQALGISKPVCFAIYIYSWWVYFFAEYALILLVIYSVFNQAMKPLAGLHQAGKIIFRWVAGVSLTLSVGVAIGPHMATRAHVLALTSQMDQGLSVLMLCLLLFVCFSTRYLGLTYRSHIFGVSLGLGIYATVNLVESAWVATRGAASLYSPVYLFSALGACVVLLTWGTYFALPVPERKMILLPTTSPFFLWNRVSEALGDEPGFVAVAGFKPDMLAPAELTVFTAASKYAREREATREREAGEERAEREAANAMQHAMGMHSIAMPR